MGSYIPFWLLCDPNAGSESKPSPFAMVLSTFGTTVGATGLRRVATLVFAGIALFSDWLFRGLLAASLDDRVQYTLLRVRCYIDVICQGFLRNGWLSKHILQ
ncbi:hypothetical protein [Noviherbaspirillum malthae]|uniref:hypothetical protein n=1 Tax=Noviherbaspirillum malthae TaxID=1260987 RepID=UPI00188E547C|nr:hypothetical protein [Noviherbaspirillum malthae]